MDHNKIEMKQELLELLAKSLDEQLPAEEAARLESALAEYAWLKEEQAQLLQLRALLGQWEVPANPGFADGVMQVITQKKQEDFTVIFVRLFPKVAVACALFILVSLTAIYLTEGNLSPEAIIGMEDISVDDVYSFTE